MTIDVFFGATPQHASEQRVLRQVREKLRERGQPAVVFADFICANRQIDLMIATATATLVIEVKSYRVPVVGGKNGEWAVPSLDESRPNGYRQALEAAYAFKDVFKTFSGVEPSYAHAVVLFERGIPEGSVLDCSDFKVTVCGIERLDELLATSTPRPWDLNALRGFARHHRFTPVTDPDLQADPLSRMGRASSAPPGAFRPAPPMGSLAGIDPTAVRTASPSASDLKRKARWIACATMALVLAAMVAAFRPHRPVTPAVSAQSPMTVIRHAQRESPVPRPRIHLKADANRKNMEYVPTNIDASSRVPSANPPPTGAGAIVPDATVPAIAVIAASQPIGTALPPCPPNTERLGCITDAQTLAKLRGR